MIYKYFKSNKNVQIELIGYLFSHFDFTKDFLDTNLTKGDIWKLIKDNKMDSVKITGKIIVKGTGKVVKNICDRVANFLSRKKDLKDMSAKNVLEMGEKQYLNFNELLQKVLKDVVMVYDMKNNPSI